MIPYETGLRGHASSRVCRLCGAAYSPDCKQCCKPYEEQRVKLKNAEGLEDNG